MDEYKSKEILSSLKSDLRREILKLIFNREMTTQEVFEIIKAKEQFTVCFRENIYKELEKLVKSGLAIKRYDMKEKKFYYGTNLEQIIIDIKKNNIEFVIRRWNH